MRFFSSNGFLRYRTIIFCQGFQRFSVFYRVEIHIQKKNYDAPLQSDSSLARRFRRFFFFSNFGILFPLIRPLKQKKKSLLALELRKFLSFLFFKLSFYSSLLTFFIAISYFMMLIFIMYIHDDLFLQYEILVAQKCIQRYEKN